MTDRQGRSHSPRPINPGSPLRYVSTPKLEAEQKKYQENISFLLRYHLYAKPVVYGICILLLARLYLTRNAAMRNHIAPIAYGTALMFRCAVAERNLQRMRSEKNLIDTELAIRAERRGRPTVR